MSMDPFALCPCGSGKKFKACCAPIAPGLQHALEQANSGKPEDALRILEQIALEHPGNPEVWGHRARLLLMLQRLNEADEALDKAFALNANYPFGLLLRASLRHAEGELSGALTLARRAADAYAPGTNGPLAEVWQLIFDCEMRRNNVIAGRAALERITQLQPGAAELRNMMEQLFGAESRLPLGARKKYELRKAAPENRATWNRVLTGLSRLGDLAQSFAKLTSENPQDTAAWFNLGLARGWIGDNQGALQALDVFVEQEADENAAVEAVVLSEVLRCGSISNQGDYRSHFLVGELRAPQPVQALLDEWANEGRIIPMQSQEEGILTAMVLEPVTGGLVTSTAATPRSATLAGYLLIAGNVFRFSSPMPEAFERVRDQVRRRLGNAIGQPQEGIAPAQFSDIVAEALLFPPRADGEEAGLRKVNEHVSRFFEEKWPARALRSLNGRSPTEAARLPQCRTRVLGLIRFLQECAEGGVVEGYDFDRVRRKLGLLGGETPATPIPASAPVEVPAPPSAETMTEEELEKAHLQAVLGNQPEQATRFAEALVARPAGAGKADRYPWYAYLIETGLREGALDAAMDRVNEGEKADCEHNGGKRRNDFELLRGRTHAKRGETELACDVLVRLVERVPQNFMMRGKAVEALLSAKQAAAALRLAEQGAAAAEKAKDRDSEQYMRELASAARKQGA